MSSEARFLRRLARRRGQSSSRAVSLRREANELLDRVLAAYPSDDRAIVEKGLLLLDSGQLDEAHGLLREMADLRPNATNVRYALARCRREIAKKERARLDDAVATELLSSWAVLQREHFRFRPLVLLAESRSYAALDDGAPLQYATAQSLNELWGEIRTLESKGNFERWWSVSVRQSVFGRPWRSRQFSLRDLPVVERRMETHTTALDRLEEEYSNRFVARSHLTST